MTYQPESQRERWLRRWHLHEGDVKLSVLSYGIAAAMLLLLWFGKEMFHRAVSEAESAHWWNALPEGTRYRVAGIGVEALGVGLLWRRWRRGPGLRAFGDVRTFFGEIALLVVGLLYFAKAMGGW
jgi:hypothetical protein